MFRYGFDSGGPDFPDGEFTWLEPICGVLFWVFLILVMAH